MKRKVPSTRIPLRYGTQWFIAIVSRRDAHLGKWSWHAIRSKSGAMYARRAGGIYLHREILNAPANLDVDHKNGNTLDCRRSNLRLATRAQNMGNAIRPSHNSSGFKGVALTAAGRWRAYIKRNRKQIHLGVFASKLEAAKAYDEAAVKLFGEFARCNFIRA